MDVVDKRGHLGILGQKHAIKKSIWSKISKIGVKLTNGYICGTLKFK